LALCPPDFRTNEGNRIGLNAAQERIWYQWEHFKRNAAKMRPFDLVLNGDLVQGNVKGKSTEIISPDIADHALCAIETLGPLRQMADRCWVVLGTETHTGTAEMGIAKALGAEWNRKNGSSTFDRLDIEVNGVKCRFVHHGGGAKKITAQPGSVWGEYCEHVAASTMAGRKAPRVLGIAHLHHFVQASNDFGLAFRTPSWQYISRHAMKVVPYAENIYGGVYLDFREEGKLPTLIADVERPPE
jgi:hypothetical protein